MKRFAPVLLLALASACSTGPDHGVPIAGQPSGMAYSYRGTVWNPSQSVESPTAEVHERAAKDCPNGHTVVRVNTTEAPLPTGWLYTDYDALVQCM
jgi:hypothetical protein